MDLMKHFLQLTNCVFRNAAKSSTSASELVPDLLDYGFSSGDALQFALDICARVPCKKAACVNVSYLMRC